MPRWVKVAGIIAVVLVLLVVGVLALGPGEHGPRRHGPAGGDPSAATDHGANSPVSDGATEIAVTANNLAFDPAEITVRIGTNVAIVLTSVDTRHDFTIDELNAHVSAAPGETARGGFHAAPPGQYTFYCAEPGHRDAGMEGTLIVTGGH